MSAPVRSVDVEIVVPVYDEQAGLAAAVARLHRYLTSCFLLTWLVTVADNASHQGRRGRRRHYSAAMLVALLPLVLTVAALLVAGWAGVDSLGGDLAIATVVNGGESAGRFLLLGRWVFR